MAASLIKFPERHTYDVSSVCFVMSAAAPMGVGVEEHLRQLFNVPFISQSYGLTETGYNSGNTTDRHRLGSNGVPPIGTNLKIFDPETDEELPRNKTGEIRVKGDIGYLDSDGFLFIVDRLKELIKYKGLQVAPAYLEDIIVKHPGVADAAVIGIPDPDAGELPRAYVVRQTGSHITAKDIVQYVHDHVAPHMRLRGGVEFIPEVPRTPSGKIMRRHLKPKKQTTSRL
ncbi:4CLL5-like protein [Mya arenaria]|uniref:4CLL5-like protein n=1 Tax=Mya arenaria TaxID=6604 RepID=A0ABY7GD07_MYAAR|nr:4CLL5-like protein [Mya arenaria]